MDCESIGYGGTSRDGEDRCAGRLGQVLRDLQPIYDRGGIMGLVPVRCRPGLQPFDLAAQVQKLLISIP